MYYFFNGILLLKKIMFFDIIFLGCDNMESLLIIVLVIIVIICAIAIFYATIYNKFQDYVIRINEVESIIDNCLRSKYDLINRAIPIVKSNIDKDEEIFGDIVKLRSRKIGNFELYRILKKASIPEASIICYVSFNINIVNMLGEKYICNVNFSIPFVLFIFSESDFLFPLYETLLILFNCSSVKLVVYGKLVLFSLL